MTTRRHRMSWSHASRPSSTRPSVGVDGSLWRVMTSRRGDRAARLDCTTAIQTCSGPPSRRSETENDRCLMRKGLDMSTGYRPDDHVALDWSEFYYTNCPLVSASNVDQELGWVREELKKIGIEYKFLRSVRGNNWYPHYVHNMDNLMRAGGCLPRHPGERGHPSDSSHRPHARAVRGWLHARAREGRHPPDEGPQGQEDRPVQEPEHHQERLVALPGGAGHRAHAHAQRHDPRRRGDRRVPVSGRLVRQARDADAHLQPVGVVAEARPQARPGVPPAGDGAAQRASSTRSTRRPGRSSTSRRRRARSRRSRTSPTTRTGRCRARTSPRRSRSATSCARSTPRSSSRS